MSLQNYEKFVLSLSVTVLSMGMIFTNGFFAKTLSLELPKKETFSISITVMAAITHFLMTIIIAINSHNNYKHRNFFTKTSWKDGGMFYLITLPTLMCVLIIQFMGIIGGVMVTKCDSGESLIISITSSIFLIAVLILMTEMSGLKEHGELEIICFGNTVTILFTIVSLLSHVMFHVAQEQAVAFIDALSLVTEANNCTIDSTNVSYFINLSLIYLQPFLNKFAILFALTSSVFLVKKLARFYKHLRVFRTLNHEERNVVPYDPYISESSYISLGISALFLFSVISLMLKTSASVATLLQYIFHILACVSGMVITVLSFILLDIIRPWSDTIDGTLSANSILVGLGLMGQLFHSQAMLVASICGLSGPDYPIYIITSLKYIINIITNISEGTVQWIILSKIWRQPLPQQRQRMLFTLLLLLSLNCVLGVADYTHITKSFINPNGDNLNIYLFIKSFDNIGEILGTLQRFYAAALFLCLYLSVQLNKNLILPEI